MTETKKMSSQEIRTLYQRLKPFAVRESCPDWTHWQLKTDDMVVTAYTSGKVVFQGQDLDFLKADGKSSGMEFPQAGSDEVGTGDFFGPVVTAACIVTEDDLPLLEKWHVTDSKQMTDDLIRKAFPELKAALAHSILVVDNDKYNQVHQRHNLNAIKAMLHNQCYLNLQKKGHALPSLCVVDQFAQERTYYSYLKGRTAVSGLHFETKAESKYPAVAAASVLARGSFLEYMDQMAEKWGMQFQLGAGKAADVCGRQFVKAHGMENLEHVAKVHFKNTERIA